MDTRPGADRAIGIRTQLKALAAERTPVVVRRVDQMAQIQLGGVLGGFKLDALLVATGTGSPCGSGIVVVEDELVVAGATTTASRSAKNTIIMIAACAHSTGVAA